MIYIPLKHLKPDMVLAREISLGYSSLSLLVGGQKLTETSIKRLEELQIPGAYIQSRLCDDVEVDEFIDPEFKRKTIGEIKEVLDDLPNNKCFSPHMIESLTSTAEDLVMYALSKDECLINIIDIKDYDTYTYTHSMNVGMLSVLLGIKANCSEKSLTELALCGLLHDTGKIDVPAEIVNKKGSLTEDEFSLIKTHPQNGVERLRPCCLVTPGVLSGIACHHEKFDGTGYPSGISGKSIPLYARILALADVYDALTSQRSYRAAWSANDAVEYIMSRADTQFDFDMIQFFLKTVTPYPVGTIVTLSNDWLAVVIKNSAENVLRPKIRILFPQSDTGREFDLMQHNGTYSLTITGTLKDSSELPQFISN